jgi:hypothetical protein
MGEGQEGMDRSELLAGCNEFWRREGRDSIYRVASRLVEASWGDPPAVADALAVLLLVWNQAFYRYGDLDADSVERFLVDESIALETLRRRDLMEYTASDDHEIARLFDEFMKVRGPRLLVHRL